MCNITWNAYNNFGGRSNYIHADQMPAVPTVNARLELQRYTDSEHHAYAVTEYAPLSFDRPEPISHIDPDSAGDGRWRGGLGGVCEIVYEGADEARLNTAGDGTVNPPYGLFGGEPETLGDL